MAETIRTPWHVWVVGGVSLVWNAFGAFDYLMTQTRNAGYLSQFTPEQLAYFENFPAWAVAFWAIAVWGAVLGSLLLLLRRGWAEPVYWTALAAMVATSVYTFLLSEISMAEIMGPEAAIFSALIFIVSLGLALYARRMRLRGVLK